VKKNYWSFLLAASGGALAMATLGLATATWLALPGAGWWRVVMMMAAATTPWQWMTLLLWAALTGAMFAIALKRTLNSKGRLLCAALIGALIPLGLLSVGGALNRIWPGTTGPADKPQLTAVLILYSVVVPWALGSALARWRASPACARTDYNDDDAGCPVQSIHGKSRCFDRYG
jgi:hypothetical protein